MPERGGKREGKGKKGWMSVLQAMKGGGYWWWKWKILLVCVVLVWVIEKVSGIKGQSNRNGGANSGVVMV